MIEELFEILKIKAKSLVDLGFATSYTKSPTQRDFGITMTHKSFDIIFSINWDSMEMLIIYCGIGEHKEFEHFSYTLDRYNIDHSRALLNYSLIRGDQFNAEIFSNVLDYNISKLRELLKKF